MGATGSYSSIVSPRDDQVAAGLMKNVIEQMDCLSREGAGGEEDLHFACLETVSLIEYV